MLSGTTTITTSVTENGSGIASNQCVVKDTSGNQKYVLYQNCTEKSKVTNLNTTLLPNGTYKLSLTVQDVAGNANSKEETIVIKNQLPAPALTGSTSSDGSASIKWSISSSSTKNQIKEMEYLMPGSSTWTKIPSSASWSGTYDFTLSKEGTYVIKARAVDTAGLAGKEAEVTCIYDCTQPEVYLSSMEQGQLNGTIKDANLQNWVLEQWSETGQEGVVYVEVAQGQDNIENGRICIIDVGSEAYEAGKTYMFRLTATDKAGNEQTAYYRYVKQEGEVSAKVISPEVVLVKPSYIPVSASPITFPANTNYLETEKTDGTAPYTDVTWYINNAKIAAENYEAGTDGKTTGKLSYHKIKQAYLDGQSHNVQFVSKDNQCENYTCKRCRK